MKLKQYLFAICLSGISFCGFAQKPFPKEHAIGITGGINLSKMTFRPTVVQDYKMGETMGITWRYIEEKYFGIQAELLYTKRGWKDRFDENPDLYFERTLDYIELPVLSHIFFGNNRVRGFVNLGPKFGYYIGTSTKTNISSGDALSSEHQTLPVKNKFDYGITAGGGVELRFGKHSVLMEGRYYFGLGDIYSNDKKDPYEASSNQNISVALTYLFHIRKK